MSNPADSAFYYDRQGRTTIDKDPGATLDYRIDWTDFLLAEGDRIASVVVTATGVTVVGTPSTDGTVVTVWVSGGTLNQPATLTCTITTDSTPARIEPMTIQFKITPKVA